MAHVRLLRGVNGSTRVEVNGQEIPDVTTIDVGMAIDCLNSLTVTIVADTFEYVEDVPDEFMT